MDRLVELACAKVGDYLKDISLEDFEKQYCN